MLTIRRAKERGHANHGWLDTNHTFSFARYYDPNHMGFGPLRVINEDRVSPGAGFGRHSHHSMEIISYVVEGELEHRDSMGNGSIIRPGELQYMSAGTGVVHSEYNASKSAPVHFLQIWIIPNAVGTSPAYDQKAFPPDERANRLRLFASEDGREGSIRVKQDVKLWGATLDEGRAVTHAILPGRAMWIQIVRGHVVVGGEHLGPGDGASATDPEELEVVAKTEAEILVFDLEKEQQS